MDRCALKQWGRDKISVLYAPYYLYFENMILSEVIWDRIILKHVSFEEKEISDGMG